MTEPRILTAAERPIPGTDIRRLYDLEGWWPERTVTDLELVAEQHPSVGAWRDDRLVGFARAVTDGRFHAYAEDVVVDPTERGNGIGRALMDRLAEQVSPVPILSLFCAPDLAPFYEKAGYVRTDQVMLHHMLDRRPER